jgi:hypothetical protein
VQNRKNYQQMRKQKELAKKLRQQEKQQRRTARTDVTTPAGNSDNAEAGPAATSESGLRGT